MATSALELKGLTKLYGQSRGVEDLKLSIQPGEVFGFLGPNGAGKTTTIRLIMDFIHATNGTIQVLGLDSHRDVVSVHQQVGYLSSDMALDHQLTGEQYLTYIANLNKHVDRDRLAQLVQQLQCETNRKIAHLSRGNHQKIGLVAALMHDPDLLILDEPTSGLDPLMQAQFNQLIREHAQRGKTTFMSSHVLAEVQSICDRVGFIREGRLQRVQNLSELMAQSFKYVRLHYQKVPATKELKKLAGVRKLEVLPQTITLQLAGDPGPLLTWLAKHPPRDLRITEPNLEEMFLEYYEGSNSA